MEMLLERVGIECAPLGGAAVVVPEEVTQCLIDVNCYCSETNGNAFGEGGD